MITVFKSLSVSHSIGYLAFDWALESPVAEIMISCYAAFMIFSGIFTIVSYAKAKVQNNLMKVDLVINSLYAVFGVIVFILMAVTKFS